MRQLPIQRYIDAEQTRPKLQRTHAEIAVLRKRHAINKAVFVKVMVRDGILTEFEAEQQYDSQFRRW